MNNQSTKSVANPEQGPAPPYFWTKLRAKGPKKNFSRPPPPLPLSRGQDDRTPSLSEGLDEYSNSVKCSKVVYMLQNKKLNGRGKE